MYIIYKLILSPEYIMKNRLLKGETASYINSDHIITSKFMIYSLFLEKFIPNTAEMFSLDKIEWCKLPPVEISPTQTVDSTNYVGVVGGRKISWKEYDTARQLSRYLSNKGKIVVSGLAHGIDTAAHIGALEGTGGTTAVLPSSLKDKLYPMSNKLLCRKIAMNGRVITPFDIKCGDNKAQFTRRLLERDWLIAVISRVIIVVSDAKFITGGTAWTVTFAKLLGVPVYQLRSNGTWTSNVNYDVKLFDWEPEMDLMRTWKYECLMSSIQKQLSN